MSEQSPDIENRKAQLQEAANRLLAEVDTLSGKIPEQSKKAIEVEDPLDKITFIKEGIQAYKEAGDKLKQAKEALEEIEYGAKPDKDNETETIN